MHQRTANVYLGKVFYLPDSFGQLSVVGLLPSLIGNHRGLKPVKKTAPTA
jgi:hypothetical protein